MGSHSNLGWEAWITAKTLSHLLCLSLFLSLSLSLSSFISSQAASAAVTIIAEILRMGLGHIARHADGSL